MTTNTSPNRQAIAVVGVSALFPGSSDAAGFWRDILSGKDLITDVPESHWLIGDFYDPDPSAPDKTYAKRGAFLSPVDFDALGWGVPPSTIPATDTSQLLALILAQTVLQDAAREQFESMDRSRISVILGVTSAQELLFSMVSRLQRPVWVKALREGGLSEDEVQAACDRISASYVPWQESTFPGLLGNVVAGRIANRLNLGGTNCVTDAACASAFSALSMAVNELQLGSSDMAIAGGVDTLNDIFMYMCFSKTPALSPSGDCRPFSDKADGTMLGEGLGMVALKRLADAERDGDRIYAVIRGIGTASDGRAKSVYAPVAEGQAKALRRAYELAGYGADTVELMEAHGTGTKAGDAAEFEGLRMVFDEAASTRRQWCALGSVKSQIGHTKAAAGAAGLFKAVMALHHKVLPPSIKIDAPNPNLRLEHSPFYLSTKTRPWIRDKQHPRRASVSAFGFGGSNFHVALEEYQGPAPRAERLPICAQDLFLVEADDADELLRKTRKLIDASESPALLARNSRKQWTGKSKARLAVVAGDRADLHAKLSGAATRIESHPDDDFVLPDGTAYGRGEHSGSVAFLFPGQGSQYLGMGAEAAIHFSAAREIWDDAANAQMYSDTPLHEVVFPRPGFGAGHEQQNLERLTATQWAQPAIGCMSMSLLAVLADLGIAADMLGGHSFGEVTALHAAGVLDADDLLRVARKRGELMAEAAATPGAMTALSLSADKVRELIAAHAPGLVIANHNAPNQVVVSGALDAMSGFEAKLKELAIAAKRLPVATAFHSSVVAASCEPFAEYLSGIPFNSAALPIYSNAQATLHDAAADALRAALAAQIASPVRFVEMVQAMYAAGARSFVEVGPGSVLSGLVGAILADLPHQAIHLDRRAKDGAESLLLALARMAALGIPMRIERLFADVREAPTESAKPKLSVAIDGSNYGKLYPPKGGSQALPPPNAARAMPSSRHEASEIAASAAIAPRSATTQAGSASPMNTVATTPSALAAPLAGATAPIAAEPAISSEWIAAFQHSQSQTAAAHAAFQRSMFESHSTYLQLAHSALNGLSTLLGGAPLAQLAAPALPPALVGDDSGVMGTGIAETIASNRPSNAVAPRTAQLASTAALSVSPIASADVGAAQPPAPAPQRPAPISAADAIDLTELMLSVVAEKTGYPVDMLNLGMDLEGDLGIDSIKRVEILAAVDERVPELSGVERGPMGSLHTLGEIVGYLQDARGTRAPMAAPVLHAASPAADQRLSAPTASSIDLKSLMLAVVAEKTGYPVDMLSLDMDLEGDLGIDSIKRVEILAAVDERVPALAGIERGPMSGLHTLGEIVDYLQGASSSPATVAATAAPANAVPAALNESHGVITPALGRYTLQRVAAPATGLAQPCLLDGTRVWITAGGELNLALAAELQTRGVNAQPTDHVPDDAQACIFLGGLREIAGIDDAIAINREAFGVARRLATQLGDASTTAARKGLFVTVQDTGGAFAMAAMDERRAWLCGLPALVKTAALEWPQAAVKAIDIERGRRNSDALASAIADELLDGGGEIEIALPAAGGRYTLVSVAQPVAPGAAVIDAKDVVVVSGGARGVTAACVTLWARESQARFVLLGRTELVDEPAECRDMNSEAELKRALLERARREGGQPTPAELSRQVNDVLGNREIRQTLAAIAAAGGKARYEAVDVGNPDALIACLQSVRKQFGPITALVHAAGVLADKKIAEKTDAQFDRVFDTKVEGLRALLQATSGDPLKLLCVFSSVSARCGNNGQSDYAMANEILAKVAASEARRRPGLLVKSLGWGPWEGGMVSPQLKERFAQLGVPMIPLAIGARMLVDEMRDGDRAAVELVLGGEPRPEALLSEGATARVQRLELRVQRDSHAYLEGHAVNGMPVVPMVLVAEWLSRAARSFRPGMALGSLHDFKVLKGIRLGGFDNGGDRFVIEARALPDSAGTHLQLEVRDSRGTLHYSARAELRSGTASSAAPDLRPALALDAWSGEPLYQDLLFHRGKFELIDRVDGISDNGVGAVLRGVRDAEWSSEPWQLDVAALDGGMQLAVLFGQRMLGGPNLPTSIDEIRSWSSVPGSGPIHAAAYGRKTSRSAVTTDIVLTDDRGQRLAELRGVHNHALS